MSTHPLPLLDRDDLLEFLKRVLQHQTATWEDKQGQEFYKAVCAVWERVGFLLYEMAEGALILQATGPQQAVVEVDFVWDGGATDDLTIQAGQTLIQTPWGEQYELVEDFVWTAAQTTQAVTVRSVWPSFFATLQDLELLNEWALPGGVNPKAHIRWDEFTTEAAKDDFLDAVDAGDLVFSVSGDFLVDGKIGTLDLIAEERGLPRQLNEPDAALRKRIRNLALTVTPDAILEAVNQVLLPYGVTATMVFPWEYWFTIGDPDWGGIGDPDHPISRLAHFRIEIPNLQTDVDGFIIGDMVQGVIGDPLYGIGTGDLTVEALLSSLNALLKRIKPAGVWGEAYELPL